jgi:carbonic anhydrase/acetyltransferase-like protein (isoleucine patch superfamily)
MRADGTTSRKKYSRQLMSSVMVFGSWVPPSGRIPSHALHLGNPEEELRCLRQEQTSL